MINNNLNDFKVGCVVRLEYGSNPYGIVSSINYNTGQLAVKFAEGPRVYKFTSLKVVM
tara:strand:+ start:1025 stop:1198 length:174 start_codon:yes stop_codon:yes gene_type:complete